MAFVFFSQISSNCLRYLIQLYNYCEFQLHVIKIYQLLSTGMVMSVSDPCFSPDGSSCFLTIDKAAAQFSHVGYDPLGVPYIPCST